MSSTSDLLAALPSSHPVHQTLSALEAVPPGARALMSPIDVYDGEKPSDDPDNVYYWWAVLYIKELQEPFIPAEAGSYLSLWLRRHYGVGPRPSKAEITAYGFGALHCNFALPTLTIPRALWSTDSNVEARFCTIITSTLRKAGLDRWSSEAVLQATAIVRDLADRVQLPAHLPANFNESFIQPARSHAGTTATQVITTPAAHRQNFVRVQKEAENKAGRIAATALSYARLDPQRMDPEQQRANSKRLCDEFQNLLQEVATSYDMDTALRVHQKALDAAGSQYADDILQSVTINPQSWPFDSYVRPEDTGGGSAS